MKETSDKIRYNGYVDHMTAGLDEMISPISYQFIDKNYSFLLKEKRDSVILEFGPGRGIMADYLLVNGFENVVLCEVDDQNANRLKTKYRNCKGVNVVNDNVLQLLKESSRRYNIVLSIQVVEHMSVDEIMQFYQRAALRLMENGFILSETTNAQNVIYGAVSRYLDITHCLSFTPKSLSEAARTSFEKTVFREYEILSPGDLIKLYLHDRRKLEDRINEYREFLGLEEGYFCSPVDKSISRRDKRFKKGFLSKTKAYMEKYYSFKLSNRISRYFLSHLDNEIFSRYLIGISFSGEREL